MTREEFVKSELPRFEENYHPERPFRVAVSSNFDGGDYAYGSHTECREYADTTVGWATTREDAERLLGEAWDWQEERNASCREECC